MMILAQALLLTWLLSRLLPRRLIWLAATLGLCALIPWSHGISLAAALRALWGDPSITTVQLLALAVLGRSPPAFAADWRAPALIAGIGMLFYALALGVGDFDPYRLGFQPVLLVTTVAVPALAFGWRGQALWLWLLAIDLLAFAAGALESTNFWDYLLDPLLAIACVILALRNCAAGRRQPLAAQPRPNHPPETH
jgi:hypothetical protein